jgi:flagellar capping protein FliD
MKLTLDSAKLSQALSANPKAVSTLLDAAMGKLNTALSRYTGSQGYITRSLASIESQQKSYDARMEKYNASLSLRKESLYYQYLEYQNQIADLGRTAQWLGISLGTSVDTSG